MSAELDMRQRLQYLDVFAKGSRRKQGKTVAGGVFTILGAFIIVWLFVLEIRTFFRIELRPNLIVDSSRGERMDIILNITFPHLPCELLSVDTMDEAGEIQEHLDLKLLKVDLGPDGAILDPSIKQRQDSERDIAIAARLSNPDYKGSCYGARPESENCLTCDDVRRAYAAANWRFDDGSGFEQCVEEKYVEHVQENKNNGCQISGRLTVSKVIGNLHIAPGESFFMNGRHSHDLSAYFLPTLPYNFDHKFNKFSFGDGPESLLEDPLQDFESITHQKAMAYRYFVKVVATKFVKMDGTVVDTNQYAVTHHERELKGGRDEDHPHSHHNIGGTPGIWITYDISPMKVISIEARGQTFGTTLMNICAIVGAVITTFALLDRSVYEVHRILYYKKNR